MKRLVTLLLIAASGASAQTLYVADHARLGVYTGAVPAEVARIDFSARHSDNVRQWRKPAPVTYPALIDADTGLSVPLTGTVAQAQVRLESLLAGERPATVRERGKNKKSELDGVKGGGNGTAALRVSINRLTEIIEQLDERLTELERAK